MKDNWPGEEDYLIKLFLLMILCTCILILLKDKKIMEVNEIDKPNTSVVVGKKKVPTVIINEVSIYPKEAIELKNVSSERINLVGFTLNDKSGKTYSFANQVINPNDFLVLDSNTTGISINNSNEVLTLKKVTKK